MIKYMVTGGAGFIGSNLVAALNARGETDVLVVDHLNHPLKRHNLERLRYARYLDKRELRAALRDGLPFDELRRWVFAPRATPPKGVSAERHVVCNCFDISAETIESEIKTGKSLAEIQEKLKCGTSCGSCMTEVRRMAGVR